MDYIYSSLHSPSYREKYNDFLKIDFPRVPYPTNQDLFWNLVNMGSELRKIHLMEHPILDKLITRFPSGGSNEVVKIQYKDGRVYINSDQYFGGVSEIVWKFYIGGYQPAQKWLKDRKGRTLTYEDIQHYQRIIVALTETDRIMKEIDELDLPWN
jgi:predicted helicase